MHHVRHRVAMIGAGHISPYHAAALRRIPGVQIAGVYDVDERRSESLAAAQGIRAFRSFGSLVGEGVDVVHVLTPPETHTEVTLAALNLGAHVFVEKPLATDVADCERIGAAARERGLRVCVDHSLLYDLQIERAIHAVRSGSIGRIVAVDILRSADYPPYEGGPLPPQYRSAGYPFRDLGVHQLYVLSAFLGPIEDVRADWHSLGGEPNLLFDEWRAEVRCRDGFGHVHISFNVKPIQNVIVIQGTKGMLRIEPMSMFSTRRAVTPLPKAAERVLNAYAESLQSLADVSKGIVGFLRKTVRQYDGVQRLIAEFYRTLDEQLPVPVSVDDATPVVYWVERVARAADLDASLRTQLRAEPENANALLVTGAAGGLGGAIAARLRRQEQSVRAFIRRRGAPEVPQGVDLTFGDLGDPAAVDAAVRGARVVIHAGAATKGSWIEQRTSTVVGTRNIIDSCLRHGVEQLVYISSLSVVDWAGARDGDAIMESSPLEPMPELRGAYTRAKLEAEELVMRAVEQEGLRAVIIRPGQIFGGKLPLVNAAVARRVMGRHVVLGNGNIRLPLVYIDDVVDAVVGAIERKLTDGEIIQLVDEDLPTQNEILQDAFGRSARVIRVPRAAVFAAGWVSEILLGALGRSSPVSRYRLRSALTPRTYVSQTARQLLDWKPRIGVYAGMKAVLHSDASVQQERDMYVSTGA